MRKEFSGNIGNQLVMEKQQILIYIPIYGLSSLVFQSLFDKFSFLPALGETVCYGQWCHRNTTWRFNGTVTLSTASHSVISAKHLAAFLVLYLLTYDPGDTTALRFTKEAVRVGTMWYEVSVLLCYHSEMYATAGCWKSSLWSVRIKFQFLSKLSALVW